MLSQYNLALAFHTPYSCFFHSCIFHPCNFDRIAFSTPAFSVAPASLVFTGIVRHRLHCRPIRDHLIPSTVVFRKFMLTLWLDDRRTNAKIHTNVKHFGKIYVFDVTHGLPPKQRGVATPGEYRSNTIERGATSIDSR